jgi:mRNA interferase YafQ
MHNRLYSKKFKKSYARLLKSKRISRNEVETAVEILAQGNSLPLKYQDHRLHGEYAGSRECHIKPDILLIY